MIKLRTFLLAVFFLAGASAAGAADISLLLNGAREIEQPFDQPLLVTVMRSGKDAPRFEVKDKDSKVVPVVVKALATKQEYMQYFGVEPQELAKLAEGEYTVQVFAGSDASRVAKLKMKKGAQVNEDTEGLYYRLDRQFDKLLTHSEGMIRKNGEAVPGWIYKGDALEGLGRDADALAAYREAEKAFRNKMQKERPRLMESPVYIQDKIIQLLRKKSGDTSQ